jgi:hypothetical protein
MSHCIVQDIKTPTKISMPGSAGMLEMAMLPITAGKPTAAETSATSGMPATAVTKATAGTPTTHGTPAIRMPANRSDASNNGEASNKH